MRGPFPRELVNLFEGCIATAFISGPGYEEDIILPFFPVTDIHTGGVKAQRHLHYGRYNHYWLDYDNILEIPALTKKMETSKLLKLTLI